MAVLDLVLYPDKRLKMRCDEILHFNQELERQCQDMFDSMSFHKGIGLAASQVGIMKRMFTMDITEFNGATCMMDQKYCFVNPEIEYLIEDLSQYDEGCLSFPNQNALISRCAKIKIKYRDVHGNFRENIADGIAATCIQHEFDHLNGIVISDRVDSIIAKNRIIEKAIKVKSRLMRENDQN